MKLISFDIFDTVLIRKCGLPENIFPIVAEKLFPNDLAFQQEFVQSRIYRTVVLSRTNPNYTLYDIYNTDIVAQGGLSVADGCRCLTKELDMIAC